MPYFIDTHDVAKGSFPEGKVTPEEFIEIFDGFDEAAETEGVTTLRVHVNVAEGKAFCFTRGADAGAIRRAHEKIDLPFDSITEVKTVTASDLR